MGELRAFWRIVNQQFSRSLRLALQTSRHRTVITAVLWLLFWGLLFLLFDFGWNFLERDELALIRDQISFVVWSLFFFPLMIMIGFSTCVISFSSYFQNRETRFLLTQPVSEAAVFFHKSREATGFASWATLFISLPIVITFGLNNAEGILFYPAAIAGFVPFVVLSASIGAIVAVLVGLLLPRARKLLIVLSVLAAGIGIWKIIEWLLAGRESLKSGDEQLWVGKVLDRVSVLGSDFLPSAWMTNLVDSAASADWAEYGYNLFMLSANALLLVHLALILGWLLLRPAREMVASSSSTVRYRSNGTFAKFFRSALFMLDESMREMVLKDIKTFSRSPGQWTQVLIFFGLLAFYIFNLRTFNYHIQGEYWKNIISYSNLTAIGLVLASFTGRFVFPLISLEGSRIWVLGLSPVPRSKIVMAKFWFSFIGSMSVSVLLVIASDLMLDLSFGTIVIHVSTMMLVCAGLSGLAVGLGSIFPNFEEDNPSRIISGFGGTINLVFSLAYVILTVFSVSLPYRLIPGALGNLLGLLAVGFAAVLAVFAAVIPMRIGIRTFEKTEF